MQILRISLLLVFLLPFLKGYGDGGSTALFPSIFIIDKGNQPPQRLVEFMLENNRELDTSYIRRLIKTYLIECGREGVNYEVAICQMCLETGFLRFDGSVSRFQNNFCGLGATDAHTAGDWFSNMEEGVRAHIQHLKAYASIEPIQSPVVDKRLKRIRRGTVLTVYDLTGRWATDPDYGIKINYLMKKLYLFPSDNPSLSHF